MSITSSMAIHVDASLRLEIIRLWN